MADDSIKDVVKEKYGKAALRVTAGEGRALLRAELLPRRFPAPSTRHRPLYDRTARPPGLPAEAVLASLGCGNPTALAELKPGEIVLDLGSAAASTCCSRPSASARPARRTAST